MNTISPEIQAQVARNFLSDNNLTQKGLAALMGVSQATVCRMLQGRRVKKGTVAILFRIAGFDAAGRPRKKPKPEENAILMNALADVWDGSSEHATALARLIRATWSLGVKD